MRHFFQLIKTNYEEDYYGGGFLIPTADRSEKYLKIIDIIANMLLPNPTKHAIYQS